MAFGSATPDISDQAWDTMWSIATSQGITSSEKKLAEEGFNIENIWGGWPFKINDWDRGGDFPSPHSVFLQFVKNFTMDIANAEVVINMPQAPTIGPIAVSYTHLTLPTNREV